MPSTRVLGDEVNCIYNRRAGIGVPGAPPMFHRRPAAMDQLGPGASVALAQLAGLEGFSRSVLVGLAPLIALNVLGSKESVSHAYLAASLFTLCITLNLSRLERLIARRRVVVVGGMFLILAALLIYIGTTASIVLGLGMRSAAASIFSVCLSLYIMEYIGKRDLVHNESRRLLYAGAAWVLGPAAGIALWNNVNAWSPFLLSALAGASMLAFFAYLRFGSNEVLRPARSTPTNPLRAILRYIRQPRLRIAYGITLSRSCFWVALFVFGPIYVLESGLPPWMAGSLLSVSSLLLFTAPLVRLCAHRFGTRTMIVIGLSLTGVCLLGLAFVGPAHVAGIGLWLVAALGGVILDTVGNIPFMRCVRRHERSEMTMVFSTWREASELVTPALAALVALLGPFWLFYGLLGVLHFAAAASATLLPRRI